MREIKFRAWHKHDKVMCISTSHLESWFNNPEYEVMQFIGVCDKNGKRIYENDIIKYRCSDYDSGFFIGEVFYCEKDMMYKAINKRCSKISFTLESSKYYEVIGNIYENPELLEKKEKVK